MNTYTGVYCDGIYMVVNDEAEGCHTSAFIGFSTVFGETVGVSIGSDDGVMFGAVFTLNGKNMLHPDTTDRDALATKCAEIVLQALDYAIAQIEAFKERNGVASVHLTEILRNIGAKPTS